MVILVHPSVPAKTVPELIAYAKRNPGKVNMASAGAGSAPHMAGELFNFMAGGNMVHVPYRGQGPALSELLCGQAQVLFATSSPTSGIVRPGKPRPIWVTGPTRAGGVVTPEDVAVAGKTIAAIATPGALSADSAKHLIDATGHIVMPGGIDPHVHLHHVWIKPDGTPLVTAGPEQVGRAALFGGTTTFIDFAYWRDGVSALEAIEARDKDFVGKSPCDWAYHIMLHSEPPPEFAGELAEAIQAGYPRSEERRVG